MLKPSDALVAAVRSGGDSAARLDALVYTLDRLAEHAGAGRVVDGYVETTAEITYGEPIEVGGEKYANPMHTGRRTCTLNVVVDDPRGL